MFKLTMQFQVDQRHIFSIDESYKFAQVKMSQSAMFQ